MVSGNNALRSSERAIQREIEKKVPPLLAGGGYIPLADGRIRQDVPLKNYVYYRQLLEKVIHAWGLVGSGERGQREACGDSPEKPI